MTKVFRAPVFSQKADEMWLRSCGRALALCLIAASAYGQATLTLASTTAKVRAEGITEAVGTITLTNATGSAQVIPGGTTITITYDGTITNDPAIATTAVGTAPNANVYTTGSGSSQLAGAGVGTPATMFRVGSTLTITIPAGFTNIGTGTCAAGTPPATATTLCIVPGGSLNIQGVRVNVSGISGNVNATVAASGGAIAFSGSVNSAVVANAQSTIGAVTATPAALTMCAVPQTPATLPGPATAGQLAGIFTVNVAEPAGFPTAFNAANSNAPGAASAWDEAGITPAGFQGSAPPVTRGTQIILSLSGLPAGIVLLARQQVTGLGGGGLITLGLVTPSGTGGSTTTFVGSPSFGGAVTITYEVLATGATSPTTVDTLSIPLYYTAAAGTVIPVGSAGAVQASVGPVSTVTGFSSLAMQIRFVANVGVPATPTSIGGISACIVAGSITATAGTPQSTTVNTPFATSLQALVKDGGGNPLPGAIVTFTAPQSGARGTFSGDSFAFVTTDGSGLATASITANSLAGSYNVTATAPGAGQVTYSLTNDPGPASTITATAGGGLSAFVNTAFGIALQAIVRDSLGNAVSGVNVTFAAPGSGASGTFSGSGTSAMVATNASGVATAPTFTANSTTGGYTVTASAAGVVTPANFNLTNIAGSPAVLSLGSNPVRVRAEGITEAVGLITLTNISSVQQVIPGGTAITITFDGTITNDPGVATANTSFGAAAERNIYTTGYGSSQQDGGGGIAQYVGSGDCTISPPGPGCVGLATTRSGPTLTITVPTTFVNTVAGTCGAAGQLCIVPGGTLSIQGVRLNLAGPVGNVNATFASNTITFAGGISSTVVAKRQPTIGSVSVVSASLSQCGLPTTPLPTGRFFVNVSELPNFTAAFNAATNPSAPGFPNVWDEAGITPGGIGGATTGSTTAFQLGFQGTAQPVTRGVQIVLSITGVPTGVNVQAPQAVITGTGAAITLGLVVGGGTPGTSTTTFTSFTPVAGATTITYEVASTGAASPTTIDTLSIPVYYTAPSGTTPPLGPAGEVQVSVGPVSPTTGFSTTATQIRFVANTSVPATPLRTGTVFTCLPLSITATAGSGQSATVNTTFARLLQATVLDSLGNPVAGVVVQFTAPVNFTGPSGTFGNVSVAFATTNASGVATPPVYSANSVAGAYNVTAQIILFPTVQTTFSLTNSAGSAGTITAAAGSGQSANLNAAFGTALQALVKDSAGNPVSGASVTFLAPGGASGLFAGGLSTVTVITDPNGVATAPIFTANTVAGTYFVTARSPGATPANFTLTNSPGSAASVSATVGFSRSTLVNTLYFTAFQATVRDSFGNPVPGTLVTFTAPGSGASGTFPGASLQATATSNASGIAVAPAFTANSIAGTFTVAATVVGVATPANFGFLTNLTSTSLPSQPFSNPIPVRFEGITEMVGPVILTNNTNAAMVIPAGSTITLQYDGNITNDPGVATTPIGAVFGPDRNIYTTGAGSSQQDGGGGIAQYQLFGACTFSPPSGGCVGLVATRSGGSTLNITVPPSFVNTGTGICAPFSPPATASSFCLVPGGALNIAGVRVNVSGLLGNVFATINATPSNALTFPGGINATVVAQAQSAIGGLAVVGPAVLSQCALPVTPTTLPGPAIAPQLAGGFYVNVTESVLLPTAFNAAGGGQPWDEAALTPGGLGSAATPPPAVVLVFRERDSRSREACGLF